MFYIHISIWIFDFLRRCCHSAITAKTFTGLDCIYELHDGCYGRLDFIYELHDGCFIRNRNCLHFVSTWVQPRVFNGFRVAHLYVLSTVLWCPLRFRHENDVRFVFSSSCL